jgi:hypothetical protein
LPNRKIGTTISHSQIVAPWMLIQHTAAVPIVTANVKARCIDP